MVLRKLTRDEVKAIQDFVPRTENADKSLYENRAKLTRKQAAAALVAAGLAVIGGVALALGALMVVISEFPREGIFAIVGPLLPLGAGLLCTLIGFRIFLNMVRRLAKRP